MRPGRAASAPQELAAIPTWRPSRSRSAPAVAVPAIQMWWVQAVHPQRGRGRSCSSTTAVAWQTIRKFGPNVAYGSMIPGRTRIDIGLRIATLPVVVQVGRCLKDAGRSRSSISQGRVRQAQS
jgi:hypothetical protein